MILRITKQHLNDYRLDIIYKDDILHSYLDTASYIYKMCLSVYDVCNELGIKVQIIK